MGSATVLVDPGATLDVDTLAGAWAVAAPTEKQLALCAEGAKIAARASRPIADSDRSTVGLGVGEDCERVLAVKMSDKCPHGETNWSRTSCGHSWCAKCQGWIDPGTRVGISAATPVVSCNRRPQPAQDYPLAFTEMSNGPARLVTEFETAKRKRGVKRREWLARHDPLLSKNPYQDLRTKVGYDTANTKCKER